MTQKKQEVQTQEQVELVTQNTELVAPHQPHITGLGFEGLTDDVDIMMPVAKLMQGNSPELDLNPQLRKGDIVHSLLVEKLPETFTPILFFDDKILMVPRNEADKEALKAKLHLTDAEMDNLIICRAQDGKTGSRPRNENGHFGNCATCQLFRFGETNADQPVCMHNLNALVLFDDFEIPTVIRFSKTSFKSGKKLLSLAKLQRDIHSAKFKLSSVQREKDGDKYYVFDVSPAGKASAEVTASAREAYSQFSTQTIRYHEEVTATSDDIPTIDGDY